MIAQKVLFTVVALAAAAAAAMLAVFGLGFAIYALLRQALTPAGSAAVMALVAALFAATAGLFAANQLKFKLSSSKGRPAKGRDRSRRAGGPVPPSMIDRVIEIVRERPFVAAGAAVAAGLIALRNPVIISAAVRAFLDPPRRRDGR